MSRVLHLSNRNLAHPRQLQKQGSAKAGSEDKSHICSCCWLCWRIQCWHLQAITHGKSYTFQLCHLILTCVQLISYSISTWEGSAMVVGSCSSPRGTFCESGHGGHQQGLRAQDWQSRESVHPLGFSSMAWTGVQPCPVSPWAHTDPRAIPAEAEGAVLVPFWCPWCRRALGRSLRALSSGDRAPLTESPTLLRTSLPTQPVLWLCGSMNLPGGSQHQ